MTKQNNTDWKTKNPDWKEEADQRTKELTDKLENGMKDLFSSDKYAEYLKTMSKFHNYSSRNVMLIHQQMPKATKVASFKSWKENFKRDVKKGETGLRIFAPIGVKTPETKLFEKLDPVTDKPMLDANGKVIMEELTELTTNIRYKLVPVFDVSQTHGEPLPQLAENLTGNVEHYSAFLDTLKVVSPLPIEFEQMNPDQDGYCKYGEKIGIREGMSEIQTVSAIIHEITHERLHNRDNATENDTPKSKRVKEIEAESVSYVVCQKYGIETGDNSFGYLASWSNSDMKEFQASLDTIRKEANSLINAIDDRFALICKERGIDLNAAEPTTQSEKPTEPKYTTESTTQNIAGVDFSVEEVKPVNAIAIEQQNFQKISEMFPQIASGEYMYQHFETIENDNTLAVEWTDENKLTLSMKFDPVIVMEVDREAKTATAIELQQVHPPLHQTVDKNGDGYSIDINGKESKVYNLQAELNDFSAQFLSNIKQQDFIPVLAALRDEEYSDPTVYFNADQKPYSLAFVYDSEGTTILNNLDKGDNGNLAKVARVDSFRNVEFFEENLPKDVVMIVENVKLINERTAEEKQTAAEATAETNTPPPTQTEPPTPPPPSEPPQTQESTEPMPDLSISRADMENYGYTAEDMLPLNQERAVDLFNKDHTVFLLYNDGTEAMAFDVDEIKSHDGIFGIEREDWQKSNDYAELENQAAKSDELQTSAPPVPPTPPEIEKQDIPKNEIPVYKDSLVVACEKGEKALFVESQKLNQECGNAIDKAISDSNYEQYRYDLKTALKDVTEEFGADRVAWVVASNVNHHDFDGRLSNANKDWAKKFDTPQPDIHLKTHLTVLNGFVDSFRKAEKEKPSLMTALKNGEEKSRREFSNTEVDAPKKSIKKTGEEL